MGHIVTGELYVELDRKLTEIKKQMLLKGGYPFNPHMLNTFLQMAIEGLLVSPFKVWRTMTINKDLKEVGDFLTAFTSDGLVFSREVRNFLENDNFEMDQTMTYVNLVIVSAHELGLKRDATTSAIFERGQKFGFSLCPNGIAAQLRVQYQDQPKGELLRIAMKPVKVADTKILFSVYNTLDGALTLGAVSGDPYARWDPEPKWVFLLPKRD